MATPEVNENCHQCTFQIFGRVSGSADRGGVTAVSNLLILGGWVIKVLKYGDEK